MLAVWLPDDNTLNRRQGIREASKKFCKHEEINRSARSEVVFNMKALVGLTSLLFGTNTQKLN